MTVFLSLIFFSVFAENFYIDWFINGQFYTQTKQYNTWSEISVRQEYWSGSCNLKNKEKRMKKNKHKPEHLICDKAECSNVCVMRIPG